MLYKPNEYECRRLCAPAGAKPDFEYKVLGDGTVEIIRYIGESGDVEIPRTIDGKTVSMIGERAFAQCYSVKWVVIPDGVSRIGDRAFSFCKSLNEVIIHTA